MSLRLLSLCVALFVADCVIPEEANGSEIGEADMGKLSKAGISLSEQYRFSFNAYFPERKLAERAARKFKGIGCLAVEHRQVADNVYWVGFKKDLVPRAQLSEFHKAFEEIVDEFKGGQREWGYGTAKGPGLAD